MTRDTSLTPLNESTNTENCIDSPCADDQITSTLTADMAMDTEKTRDPHTTPCRSNPWVILSALCMGFFMILLDATIVNVALDTMMHELGATFDEVLWVVNAYMLVFASLLIVAGRLGDIYTPRALFLIGMGIFTVASALCGLSSTPTELIAARILQGIGGAMLVPQTLTILTSVFPPQRRGTAFGAWGAVAGLATLAGPTLGGFLVTRIGWEAIFYVNVPVGLGAIALAYFVLPHQTQRKQHILDWPGVVLVTSALFLIVFALTEGERFSWGEVTGFVTIPRLLVAGVALLLTFLAIQVAQSRRVEAEPLVPMEIFRNWNFSLMNIVALSMGFAMLGLMIPLMLYFQGVLGFSAEKAGLTLAPMALASMVSAPLAGRMTDRYGGKYVILSGLGVFALGFAWVTLNTSIDARAETFILPLLIAGIGVGCVFAPMTTVALRTMPTRLAGAASGVFNTTRQVGQVMGAAAVGAVFQAQFVTALHTEARDHAGELPPEEQAWFVGAIDSVADGGLSLVQQGAGELSPPAGVSVEAAAQIEEVATSVFGDGFVDAMRSSFLLPLAVMALAWGACWFIRRRRSHSSLWLCCITRFIDPCFSRVMRHNRLTLDCEITS